MSVASRHAPTISGEFRDGHLFIPVLVNGAGGKYVLDTGANFSTLTASEAKRLGLRFADLNGDAAQTGEASGTMASRALSSRWRIAWMWARSIYGTCLPRLWAMGRRPSHRYRLASAALSE